VAAPAFRASGAPAKSPDAFRTISEVATDLDVPQHVLRFWESRFAQIKPVKRAGGRRFYRPDDVDLLRGIRALLYVDGLTIRGVQKVLKERGVRHVAQIGRGQVPAPYAAPAPAPAIVVEAPAEKKPDAKKRPNHLRAVPSPMSLPFFEALDSEPSPSEAVAVAGMAAEERAKLKALLGELEGLKKGLNRAHRRAKI
jgi:DNA-binding transcriptional MerR regulator